MSQANERFTGAYLLSIHNQSIRIFLKRIICESVPNLIPVVSGIPRNFVFGGGVLTNSVEDRGQRSGGGSPLVRGSGGSCNFVQ